MVLNRFEIENFPILRFARNDWNCLEFSLLLYLTHSMQQCVNISIGLKQFWKVLTKKKKFKKIYNFMLSSFRFK